MNDHSQTLIIDNNFSETDRLHTFWHMFSRRCDISDEVRDELLLVIEETFSNIVNYAYDKTQFSTIKIEFHCSTDSVTINFIDEGMAFDPLSCDSDVVNVDLCEGGMGIHLIRSLTDEQRYRRIKQHNVFTVTKHCTKVS